MEETLTTPTAINVGAEALSVRGPESIQRLAGGLGVTALGSELVSNGMAHADSGIIASAESISALAPNANATTVESSSGEAHTLNAETFHTATDEASATTAEPEVTPSEATTEPIDTSTQTEAESPEFDESVEAKNNPNYNMRFFKAAMANGGFYADGEWLRITPTNDGKFLFGIGKKPVNKAYVSHTVRTLLAREKDSASFKPPVPQ